MASSSISKKSKKGMIDANVKITDVDMGWDAISKEVKKFKKSHTSIGFFTTGRNASNDIATRAIVNEFGATIPVTKKMRGFFLWMFKIVLKASVIIIPERPFMRNTFDKNKGKINGKILSFYRLVIDKKLTAKQALSQLGEWYSALIKLTIRGGDFHPNAPLTIKQKGSSKPLNDTGEMANSIEHREIIKG